MELTFTQLFHIYRDHSRLVVYLMDNWGRREVYLPGNQTLTRMWPKFTEAQPYLDTWFDRHAGHTVTTRKRYTTKPGDTNYPSRLAEALSCSPYLNLWAYATVRWIYVSFHQIALALGRKPSREVREQLQQQGVTFVTNGSGNYEASLMHVERLLGPDFASRILLYPGQVAGFLGVTRHAVPDILRRLDIALERRSRTVVEWRSLRRVERVSRRGFRLRPISD
jgi:hypothetical protein